MAQRNNLINMQKRRNQSGFTLLEIIVVVAIIAILAAYIAPKVAGRVDDARISKAKNDIRVLESSLELYKLDNFVYPSTEQGLDALVINSREITLIYKVRRLHHRSMHLPSNLPIRSTSTPRFTLALTAAFTST